MPGQPPIGGSSLSLQTSGSSLWSSTEITVRVVSYRPNERATPPSLAPNSPMSYGVFTHHRTPKLLRRPSLGFIQPGDAAKIAPFPIQFAQPNIRRADSVGIGRRPDMRRPGPAPNATGWGSVSTVALIAPPSPYRAPAVGAYADVFNRINAAKVRLRRLAMTFSPRTCVRNDRLAAGAVSQSSIPFEHRSELDPSLSRVGTAKRQRSLRLRRRVVGPMASVNFVLRAHRRRLKRRAAACSRVLMNLQATIELALTHRMMMSRGRFAPTEDTSHR